MFYTVEWAYNAEMELAAIWLRAANRQAVTPAQAAIDRLLRVDPVANGTALSEGLWRLAVPPLVVFYSIDETQRHVTVSWVAKR
jgi:hypothetical protein